MLAENNLYSAYLRSLEQELTEAAQSHHPLADIPASFGIGKRWYVFCVHPNREKSAQTAIADLGFVAYVPFERKLRRKPGRKPQLYEKAYFQGYGFVQFDINDQRWGSIINADGVADLLRTMNVPRPINDSVIDELRLAESLGLLDSTKPPKAGIEVEVTEGPFSALIGKVIRARAGDRAEVLLQGIFGKVTLPLAYLRER